MNTLSNPHFLSCRKNAAAILLERFKWSADEKKRLEEIALNGYAIEDGKIVTVFAARTKSKVFFTKFNTVKQ